MHPFLTLMITVLLLFISLKKYTMSKSYYKFIKIKEIIYIMNYNLHLHTFEKVTYICTRHYLFALQSMVAASIDLQTLIKILKYHQRSIGYKLGTTLQPVKSQ